MKKISKLVMMYKEDADAYGDHDMAPINEVLDKLEESLLSLNESEETVVGKINELKSSSNDEQKEIINDFLQYYKYYGK